MTERLAPVDEYGMPYAIHPFDPPKRTPNAFKDGSLWLDEDHAWYCRSAPELTDDEAGKTLRVSRAQTTGRWLHVFKHQAYPGGLERYPETEQDKFALLVLTGGGYLSRTAIDYRDPDNPKDRLMSRRTYEKVRKQDTMHIVRHTDAGCDVKTGNASRARIGRFFADYSLRQDLKQLDERTIDIFLHSTDETQRGRAGKFIIFQAIEHAVDPINPMYAKAFEDNDVAPVIASAQNVVHKFFYRKKWPDYFKTFDEQLRSQLGLTSTPLQDIINPVIN